jgi:hypothetical protein
MILPLNGLLLSGCTDTGIKEIDQVISRDYAAMAVQSVIEKANHELTQPHSTLLPTGYPKGEGSQAYVSLATYWWPDPDRENGLPYIRKDGQVNPETMSEHSNLPQLVRMARRVEVLGAAYRFTGNGIYASRAIEQLKKWFIDPENRMLPHLEHAQLIRGINSGRSYGIIDGWWLVRVVDSIPLLRRSHYWSKETDRRLAAWFTHYVNWLRNSEFGQRESTQKNNHGTWYDVQIVVFSKFIGWDSFAEDYLDNAVRLRTSDQILFSGKQRHETSRTRPEHYSIYNLYGLFRLARVARDYGLDLTQPRDLFSGSLLDAYRYLIDQIGSENPDRYILPFDETDTARIWYSLHMEAVQLFDDPEAVFHLHRIVLSFPGLYSRTVSSHPEMFIMLTQGSRIYELR